MITQIINFLLEQQNKDGSWGFFPGKAGAIEPTAYALMSLEAHEGTRQAVNHGLEFLHKTQTARGAWPVNTQDSEDAAWATALAGLALSGFQGTDSMCSRAAQFVVDSFGRHPRLWVLRLADWMRSFDASYVEENLRGWKWTPETANWVEPTAYGVLFLKMFLGSKAGQEKSDESHTNLRQGLRDQIAQVIIEGEALLYQRMCKEGGWNCCSGSVLDQDLRPYPLTTARTLVTLQDRAVDPRCQKSLAYLKGAVGTERSALTLCLATLCFDLYGIETEPLIQTIYALHEETQFFQNINTSALVLLAQQSLSGENAFRLKSQ